MEVLLILILLGVVPFFVSWKICVKRNRNPWKGLLATLFFGWFATIGLATMLKTRDPATGWLR